MGNVRPQQGSLIILSCMFANSKCSTKKDVRGLLHVSALVKEMLALMEKIASGGSQADKFVCQVREIKGFM